jgi:DNA-binding NarL/FixJ family response regulator
MTIRVFLADDHTLFRNGVRALLERIPDVQVVGEAADGRAAVSEVRATLPTVVLMDIGMPVLNGLDATTQILQEKAEIRVVILSMHFNEEYIFQALRTGASGYLLKSAAAAELEMALRVVANGETFLSPTISKRFIQSCFARMRTEPPDQLTSRQREILQLIVEGKSTKEIAFVLNLSAKTVEAHRVQLMNRLNIRDVPGLVRYAMRVGIVPPET